MKRALASLLIASACTGGASTTKGDPAAASDAGADSGLTPCNALNNTADTLPSLQAAPAIGRAKGGTIYVVLSDDGNVGELRVFTGNPSVQTSTLGPTFEQQRIKEVSYGTSTFTISLADSVIEVNAPSLRDRATRMAVSGEELTLLAGSDLAGFKAVIGIDDAPMVAFNASTHDGRGLIVLTPAFAVTPADGVARVFYNPTANAAGPFIEQHATVFVGDATSLTFTFEGTSFSAYLPNDASLPSGGGPTLHIGGETLPLTYAAPATGSSGGGEIAPSFVCF